MWYQLLFSTLFFVLLSGESVTLMAQARADNRAAPATATSYTGAGSCTSSNCHGSVWPKTGGKIDQNEYTQWAAKDKHAKAYAVLFEPRSKQIARNLMIERPETATVCLDCHATNAAANERASSFDISDGVGCESCHGPASAWLGQHTTRDWTHGQSVRAGMVDTKDVKKRTEVCLSCHLGTEKKTVDHDLIAAGHPALIFELETFSALMPAHWRKNNEQTDTVRRWALAQAIGLRESMSELQRSMTKSADSWPDFSEFECMSCHHALVLPSARQDRGYTGRPGLPGWNEARYVVLRHLIGAVSPAAEKELEIRISELKKSLERPSKDRQIAALAAQRIADLMTQSIPLLEKAQMNEQFAMTIVRDITSDAANIAEAGMGAAEQATMSLDVLYGAAHPDREDPINVQIGHLYEMLQSHATYDPVTFASALRRLENLHH